MSLKLLIDSKAKKVLFGEAGKDFVDFLFQIMSLPIGTVIRLVTEKEMVGCLGHLYKSIYAQSSDYFQPNVDKDALLKPNTNTKKVSRSAAHCMCASYLWLLLCFNSMM